MKITVTDTEKQFFDLVAWRIAMEISNTPNGVFGFSTGRTTKEIHASLAEIRKNYRFDTSKITVFGLDEITNVSREYSGSCYYILFNDVIKPLGIPLENFIMPPTYSDDFEKECRNFENAVSARGPVTLQILGIGENGHIGFNQPGALFGSGAWLSKMDEELSQRIYRETNSPPDAKLGGLTLGIKNIMQSGKIILAANGSRKAKIVRDALYGPVTEELPASILQLHPNCEVILDADAAKEITTPLQ
jgi:glucosamine-6-phosphate deaminase